MLLARASCALAVVVALASGCGHAHPPPMADPGDDGDASAAAQTTGFETDASDTPPKCELVTPDGGICGCTDVPLLGDPPTLYFVLDRSGSMNDENKWIVVRNVVSKLITSLGPRAKFGAAVFPTPGAAADCAPGIEVMSPRRGDAPAGYSGYTAATFAGMTNYGAGGGTPTAATLRNLAGPLGAIGGHTFVILATDGGPNCNDGASCNASACIPNIESAPGCSPNVLPNCCDPQNYGPASCLDTDPTVSAVDALHKAGIPTYVVGVPGSGPYSDVLDKLARAGGTARTSEPLYYRVDTSDEAALLAALSQIAASIVASCTLSLPSVPDDPGLVNVYIDEAPVAKDPTDGWSLDGQTVTLLGATCSRVLSGAALDVRVVVGCPTVAPK